MNLRDYIKTDYNRNHEYYEIKNFSNGLEILSKEGVVTQIIINNIEFMNTPATVDKLADFLNIDPFNMIDDEDENVFSIVMKATDGYNHRIYSTTGEYVSIERSILTESKQ